MDKLKKCICIKTDDTPQTVNMDESINNSQLFNTVHKLNVFKRKSCDIERTSSVCHTDLNVFYKTFLVINDFIRFF